MSALPSRKNYDSAIKHLKEEAGDAERSTGLLNAIAMVEAYVDQSKDAVIREVLDVIYEMASLQTEDSFEVYRGIKKHFGIKP